MSGPPERSRGLAGPALGGVLLLSLVIFGAVAFAGWRKSPDLGGLLGGVFGGLFTALLFAGAGAWTILALTRSAKPSPMSEAAQALVIQGTLQQTLDELERIRLDTQRQVHARAIWRVPVCVAGAVALWIRGQFGGDPPGLFELLTFSVMGGVIGYVWASSKLGERYRRLYKDRVLPQLAAQFGQLTYREAQFDPGELTRHNLFATFDRSRAEDEICGDYRGLPISIVELTLTFGSGDDKRTIFDGLMTAVTLPRKLVGTTVVAADRGLFGNLRERLRGAGGCEKVDIEDPVFEKAYEIYGTDQIAARALLTPAFMERFLQLANSGRFGAPLALVQDNRLLLAMPKTQGGDLFEPPSYSKPAAGREALASLTADIQEVLAAADAVIDLDQAARAQAAPRA